MRLRYRYSVVSFCPDLTKGEATSIPLAVLLVGKSDTAGVAVIAASQTPPTGLDPISRAVIKDLVEVIKEHVDTSFDPDAIEGDVDPADVIHSFEQSLRNSIHVSFVSDERSLDAEDTAEDIVPHAIKEAMQALKGAVRRQPTRSEGTPIYLLQDDGLFNTRSWPLPWLYAPESSRPSSRH